MLMFKKTFHATILCFVLLMVFKLSVFSQEQDWKTLNEQLIKKYSITSRYRSDVIDTGVKPNLVPGAITNLKTLKVNLGTGVTGYMYWGKGILVNFMSMEPGAEIPKEILPSERLMIMTKGSVQQLVNGKYEKMICTKVASMYYFSTGYLGYKDCLYLGKGTENTVKAG